MYIKQRQISLINRFVFIAVIALAVMFLALQQKNSPATRSPDAMQNYVEKEYYKTYTVERTNGKVSAVYVDLDVYDIDHITGLYVNSEQINSCDNIVDNEEGQQCYIDTFRNMWLFLNSVGYSE